jgi:hypothetical protein
VISKNIYDLKLHEENTRLRAALEFYEYLHDDGKIAREALKDTK